MTPATLDPDLTLWDRLQSLRDDLGELVRIVRKQLPGMQLQCLHQRDACLSGECERCQVELLIERHTGL